MSLRITPKQARNLFKQKGTTKQPSDKPIKITPSEDAIQCAVLDWAKLVKYKGKKNRMRIVKEMELSA